MYNPVAWLEGMFLRPQHFQCLSQYFQQLAANHSQECNNHHWGMLALDIDETLLKQGKIGLNHCIGIFLDGAHFNAPKYDLTPTCITPNEKNVGQLIYIGIPNITHNHPAYSDKQDAPMSRYFISSSEVQDISDTNRNISEVYIGKLRLQLLTEQDSLDHYTCLPFAKIKDIRTTKEIILDTGFISPLVHIQDSDRLMQMLYDIQTHVQQRISALAERLVDAQQSAASEAFDFNLLQLLNRYQALLQHYSKQTTLHPESLYQLFIQLASEIATYQNDKHYLDAPLPYQHDDLSETFSQLHQQIQKMLQKATQQNAIAIELTKIDDIWCAKISDEALLKNSIIVLAVYANVSQEQLQTHFSNQVKISAIADITHLIERALPGAVINHLPIVPRQIPYHANFTYFTIDKSHPHWQMIVKHSNIALHISGNFPSLKLELWAIKE